MKKIETYILQGLIESVLTSKGPLINRRSTVWARIRILLYSLGLDEWWRLQLTWKYTSLKMQVETLEINGLL